MTRRSIFAFPKDEHPSGLRLSIPGQMTIRNMCRKSCDDGRMIRKLGLLAIVIGAAVACQVTVNQDNNPQNPQNPQPTTAATQPAATATAAPTDTGPGIHAPRTVSTAPAAATGAPAVAAVADAGPG